MHGRGRARRIPPRPPWPRRCNAAVDVARRLGDLPGPPSAALRPASIAAEEKCLGRRVAAGGPGRPPAPRPPCGPATSCPPPPPRRRAGGGRSGRPASPSPRPRWRASPAPARDAARGRRRRAACPRPLESMAYLRRPVDLSRMSRRAHRLADAAEAAPASFSERIGRHGRAPPPRPARHRPRLGCWRHAPPGRARSSAPRSARPSAAPRPAAASRARWRRACGMVE